MAKCPKCRKEIDGLVYVATGTEASDVSIAGGMLIYESKEFNGDGQVSDYECPECGEVLFKSENDAAEFLEGDES